MILEDRLLLSNARKKSKVEERSTPSDTGRAGRAGSIRRVLLEMKVYEPITKYKITLSFTITTLLKDISLNFKIHLKNEQIFYSSGARDQRKLQQTETRIENEW